MAKRMAVASEDALAELERRREQARERARRYRDRQRAKAPGPATCAACGAAVVDVHHIAGRQAGDGPANLVRLCPQHHQWVHAGLLCVLPWEAVDDASAAGVDAGRTASAP